MKQVMSTKMILDRPNNCSEEVWIDGYVHYSVETKYGSDADGNRGEKRIEVDDVTDISAYNIDNDEVKLTAKETQMAAILLGDKFLNG